MRAQRSGGHGIRGSHGGRGEPRKPRRGECHKPKNATEAANEERLAAPPLPTLANRFSACGIHGIYLTPATWKPSLSRKARTLVT